MPSLRILRVCRTPLLPITICFLSLPAYAKYSGGTGEPNDPYQIATATDLIALGETPEDYDKHFILTADINLDVNLPRRKVFDKAVIAPDMDAVESGFHGTPFTGVLDGSGHAISNFTCDCNGVDYIGLIGYVDDQNAEIKNLGLINPNIYAGTGDDVSSLVGYCLMEPLPIVTLEAGAFLEMTM